MNDASLNQRIAGPRPDLTTAQLVAVAIGGLPLAGTLAAAGRSGKLTRHQRRALRDAGRWGTILAGTLMISDALVRSARNRADAAVKSSLLATPGEAPDLRNQEPELIGEVQDPLSPDELIPIDIEADLVLDSDLPDDDEEFAAVGAGARGAEANGAAGDKPANIGAAGRAKRK